MFYIEICGGLGNQLFQLFAAFALGKNHNKKTVALRLDSSPSVFQNRVVYWNTFFSKVPTVSEKQTVHYVHNDWDPIHGFLQVVFPTELKNSSIEPAIELKGYYQHRRHFWKWKDELIQTLLPSKDVWKEWLPLNKYLNSYSLSTIAFLHIRRGDYKRLQHCHVVLPLAYYENAIQHFHPSTKFLVFCEMEDFESIKKEMEQSTILKHRVILNSDMIAQTPDYQQMILMSSCTRGGILANSTFSVWSAYLHQDKTGTFTYPDRFFAHAPQSPQIFDPTWIQVSCEPSAIPSKPLVMSVERQERFQRYLRKVGLLL